MYSFGLQRLGFQPITAATAEEAFACAREMCPDVVVSDLTLQGSSGLDLMRRLREDARTRHMGIIVLTGSADAKQAADEAGCDRFLLKPCLLEALAQEIRDVIAKRRRFPTAGRPD